MWASVLDVVLFGRLLLVVIGYLGLITYSGLANETPIVPVLLDITIPALVSVVILVALLILADVAILWVIIWKPSIPRSKRIATLTKQVEREYRPFRVLSLSGALSLPKPSADEQAERTLTNLKRQYIEGEITEAEFERKADRLVTNESIDKVHAAHERKQMGDKTSRGDRHQ